MLPHDPGKAFESPCLEQLLKGQVETSQPQATTPVSEIIARHHDALMALKGVNMLGEGLDAQGQPAIIIGVEADSDSSGIPSQVESVPIIVQVTGKIIAY